MIFIYLWGCWFWPYLNNLAGVPTTPGNHFKPFYLRQSIHSKRVFKNLPLATCSFPRSGGVLVFGVLLKIILCMHFINANWNNFYFIIPSTALLWKMMACLGHLKEIYGHFGCHAVLLNDEKYIHPWRDMPHKCPLWQSPQRSCSPVIKFFLSWEGNSVYFTWTKAM